MSTPSNYNAHADRPAKEQSYGILFPAAKKKVEECVILFPGENGKDYLAMKAMGLIDDNTFVFAVEKQVPHLVRSFLCQNHQSLKFHVIEKNFCDIVPEIDILPICSIPIGWGFFDICEAMTPENCFAAMNIINKCFADKYRIIFTTSLSGRGSDLFRCYDLEHKYIRGIVENGVNAITDLTGDQMNQPSLRDKAMWFITVCHNIVLNKSNNVTNDKYVAYNDTGIPMFKVGFDCTKSKSKEAIEYEKHLKQDFAECLAVNIDDKITGKHPKIYSRQDLFNRFITEFSLPNVERAPMAQIIIDTMQAIKNKEVKETPVSGLKVNIKVKKEKVAKVKKEKKVKSSRPPEYAHLNGAQWAHHPANPTGFHKAKHQAVVA